MIYGRDTGRVNKESPAPRRQPGKNNSQERINGIDVSTSLGAARHFFRVNFHGKIVPGKKKNVIFQGNRHFVAGHGTIIYFSGKSKVYLQRLWRAGADRAGAFKKIPVSFLDRGNNCFIFSFYAQDNPKVFAQANAVFHRTNILIYFSPTSASPSVRASASCP